MVAEELWHDALVHGGHVRVLCGFVFEHVAMVGRVTDDVGLYDLREKSNVFMEVIYRMVGVRGRSLYNQCLWR